MAAPGADPLLFIHEYVSERLSWGNYPAWARQVRCFLAAAGYPADVLDRPPNPHAGMEIERDRRLGGALSATVELAKALSVGAGTEVPGAFELWHRCRRAYDRDLETKISAGLFNRYNAFVFDRPTLLANVEAYLALVADLRLHPAFQPLVEEPFLTRNFLSHVPPSLRQAAERWDIFDDRNELSFPDVVSRLQRAEEELLERARERTRSGEEGSVWPGAGR
ncbi:hypothetical protein DFJ74DRAFT_774643 [Hyaloraphidium curvatum]|nr:hypothetical protein DFJ74DRAFT_774643 [Hyaloraphidium curvatum]